MADTSADTLIARLAALSPERRRLLADRLPAVSTSTAVPVDRADGPLPASFFQERLWLVDQMLPESSAYVVWFALRMTGPVRADLLARAVDTVVARHEVLRTGLEWRDSRLVQVVRDDVPTPVRTHDLRPGTDAETAARALLEAEAGTGFDLTKPPLMRVLVIRIGADQHVLGMFLHHAVTDGWSNGILLGELGSAYRDLLAGRDPAFTPVRLHYADVAVWQRKCLTDQRIEQLLGYWRGQLHGAPEVLDLPLDQSRRADRQSRGASHQCVLPLAAAQHLRTLAKQEKATSFMLVLGGLSLTLARWAGLTDVVIGSAQSGRTDHALDQVIGPLVNTVVLRMNVRQGMTGRELVRAARAVALDAQAHADLPFERLVEHMRPTRSAAHHPLFQVNLGVRDFPGEGLVLTDTRIEAFAVTRSRAAKFDLSVYLTTGSGDWPVTVEYNAELFSPQTMTQFADLLCAQLTALGEHPDDPVDGVESRPRPETTEPMSRPETTSHVPPRDPWERNVAMAWSQVLGVNDVGATDDFFALGGHSMAGMLAMERIQQMTGRRLDLTALFRHPTVESLAEVLRVMHTDVAAPFVVGLRPHGTRPPLFLMPTAIGELAAYFPLAKHFPADRPLYGVQPDGFFRDGEPGDLTLREQAARYAREIIGAHQGGGPYHLCGFSAAGRLAVAVADALVTAGAQVGAVVLLDSSPFGDVAPDPDLGTVLVRWLPFSPPAAELSGVDRQAQIARTLRAGQASGDLPPSLDPAEFTAWCRKLEFGARALAGHGPLSYAGVLTLMVRAGRSDRDLADEWRAMPIGDIDVHPVDVEDHMSFVGEMDAPAVAGHVAAHLAAADDGSNR